MPEKGYESISLPSELLDLVRTFLKTYPELGYSSMAEFIKEGLRSLLEVERDTLATGGYGMESEAKARKEIGEWPRARGSKKVQLDSAAERIHILEPLDYAIRAASRAPADVAAFAPLLRAIRRMLGVSVSKQIREELRPPRPVESQPESAKPEKRKTR